jgi:hypothetical protein
MTGSREQNEGGTPYDFLDSYGELYPEGGEEELQAPKLTENVSAFIEALRQKAQEFLFEDFKIIFEESTLVQPQVGRVKGPYVLSVKFRTGDLCLWDICKAFLNRDGVGFFSTPAFYQYFRPSNSTNSNSLACSNFLSFIDVGADVFFLKYPLPDELVFEILRKKLRENSNLQASIARLRYPFDDGIEVAFPAVESSVDLNVLRVKPFASEEPIPDILASWRETLEVFDAFRAKVETFLDEYEKLHELWNVKRGLALKGELDEIESEYKKISARYDASDSDASSRRNRSLKSIFDQNNVMSLLKRAGELSSPDESILESILSVREAVEACAKEDADLRRVLNIEDKESEVEDCPIVFTENVESRANTNESGREKIEAVEARRVLIDRFRALLERIY